MTEPIDLNRLAEIVLERYTPFAFACECEGSHPDCHAALQNPYLYGVMDTIRRVSDYIKEYSPNL
jgi:hypothetical protein